MNTEIIKAIYIKNENGEIIKTVDIELVRSIKAEYDTISRICHNPIGNNARVKATLIISNLKNEFEYYEPEAFEIYENCGDDIIYNESEIHRFLKERKNAKMILLLDYTLDKDDFMRDTTVEDIAEYFKVEIF